MSEIQDRLTAHIGDRYRVERELGRGGMATVFLATDVRHDREVAVKVLHPELGATIGSERFEREIRLAAKLQHPHILGLYDSGSADGLLYYVMPFIQGESVRDLLDREKQLPIDDALQITLEVADALGYAHAQGIVHRDIKPENVLMSNGHALVADFGIARARQEAGQQRLTQTGMAVGTPVYMSPEQATGEHVGPSSDIYSLGCMLYEMLAGEPPFTGPNPMAIMARHAMEGVPSVRIVRPSVPEEVEEGIFAALEKSAADRPKSAADFCAILGTPLGATATRRTSRHTAARRVPTAAALPRHTAETVAPVPFWRRPPAIAAAVVTLAGLGLIAFQMNRNAGAVVLTDALDRKVAVRYFDVAGGDVADLRPTAERLTESLIRDLSTSRELNVVSANGVSPFRGKDVSRDSIGRALKVGTLVEGVIEPDGIDHVAITLRYYYGDGSNRGDPTTTRVSLDSLFTAEEEVAREVSAALRERLGPDIKFRELQAGTRSSVAWTLFNRAERARRDAASLGPQSADSAREGLSAADSLFRAARSADDQWVEPALQAIQVAFDRRRFVKPPPGTNALDSVRLVVAALDSALARVETALSIDPSSGRAVEMRGTIKYEKWRLGRLVLDPAVRSALLNDAERDLLEAIRRDPSLVTPYATLAFLYYDKKDVPTSLQQARAAYSADEFLVNSSAILNRLFYGSYDTEQFLEARRWCDEGHARFPRNFEFTLCGLWLMLAPDVEADIDSAWVLAARVDSLAPDGDRPLLSRMARMIVGGVIGRQALTMSNGPRREARLDSARRVLESAQGDRTVDPHQELPGYRAVMLAQFGDLEQAMALLRSYVAANPDHSFRVGGNVHWWWRELRSEPGFDALLSRSR